jgi:ABC-type hemin transport system ATPase subunit
MISGGERQLVLIARALAQEARVTRPKSDVPISRPGAVLEQACDTFRMPERFLIIEEILHAVRCTRVFASV